MLDRYIKYIIKKNIKDIILVDNNYTSVHGSTLSVKIVLPCYCQANCPFCFNKQTMDTQVHCWDEFMMNLRDSLDDLFEATTRKISLDITGNEPTFDVDNFQMFMNTLWGYKKKYSSKIDKIVLTTNGFQLYKCIPYMYDVIDIVNISIHSPRYSYRVHEIFRTENIPSNLDLIDLNKRLNILGITTTSVAVIHSVIDIVDFVKKFAKFSKETGFKDTRIRFDYITDNSDIRNQFYEEFSSDDNLFEQSGISHKKFTYDDYNVGLYLGVPDLVDYVIGVELVLDDDGKLYIDYNKRFPVTPTIIRDMNNFIYIIENGQSEENCQ